MEASDLVFVFRLFVLIAMLVYLQRLLANIFETFDTFHPHYWRHYVRQQCVRPLCGVVIFCTLLLFESSLIGWLLR